MQASSQLVKKKALTMLNFSAFILQFKQHILKGIIAKINPYIPKPKQTMQLLPTGFAERLMIIAFFLLHL